jgi:hypothetical protein
MWAVKADEDYAAGVFVDRVHNPEHTRCLPLPCDRNRFPVTSVWERGCVPNGFWESYEQRRAETEVVLRCFHGCR